MKRFALLLLAFTLATQSPYIFAADPVDGSDVQREVSELDARVDKLSLDDQLKLRAAEQKAAEEPAVQAALKKRNEAIREFRAALRAGMIKADPSLAPLLEKLWAPGPRTPAAAAQP